MVFVFWRQGLEVTGIDCYMAVLFYSLLLSDAFCAILEGT